MWNAVVCRLQGAIPAIGAALHARWRLLGCCEVRCLHAEPVRERHRRSGSEEPLMCAMAQVTGDILTHVRSLSHLAAPITHH